MGKVDDRTSDFKGKNFGPTLETSHTITLNVSEHKKEMKHEPRSHRIVFLYGFGARHPRRLLGRKHLAHSKESRPSILNLPDAEIAINFKKN